MRSLLTPALVALLALPLSAGVPPPMDTLEGAVETRITTIDGSTKKGRRLVKRLRSAADRLARPVETVGDELKALEACAGKLRKPFRDDPEFDPLLQIAFDDLSSRATGTRDRLDGLRGTLDDPKAEKQLSKAVSGFDAKAARAAATDRIDRAAGRMRQAWRKVDRAERALGFGPKPDFALEDTNPNSASFGRDVSPREFLGGGSAFYFGHAT